jgi:hypothetical protein
MLETIITLVGLALVTWIVWGAYRLGRRHEARAQAAERERMALIEPPERTPGQPTNLDSPPSVVRSPRIRGSRWSSEGDMQR